MSRCVHQINWKDLNPLPEGSSSSLAWRSLKHNRIELARSMTGALVLPASLLIVATIIELLERAPSASPFIQVARQSAPVGLPHLRDRHVCKHM